MISKHKSLLKAIGGLLAIPALSVFPLQRASAAPEAIGMSGALPDFKTVEIDNAHVYDYTFTSAPTDWWVQSGVWEMTNRWACSPGWSWFGGRSQETAAVWNKRRFSGDMSVQFYFGFKMGLTGNPSWLYHPADAAVTICGDGRNVGSGYSFIVGADGNERSVLMRGTKVVAQSTKPEATLPRLTDSNMQSNLNDLHRRWFYVKFNKIGSRVECWLDNKLLFTYHDPKPLDMGQVALWTYNNGIMLSRVQVYYENEQRPDYVKLASRLNTPGGADAHSGKTIAPVIISKPITRTAAKAQRRTAALP